MDTTSSSLSVSRTTQKSALVSASALVRRNVRLYVMLIFVDFRERNATVAMRWAELPDEERKQWARKAESVCLSSIQVSRHCCSMGDSIVLLAFWCHVAVRISSRHL